MEMVLSSGFCELTEEQMCDLGGGQWYDAVLTFGGGIASTVTVCGIASGSGAAIASMGVASLAAAKK